MTEDNGKLVIKPDGNEALRVRRDGVGLWDYEDGFTKNEIGFLITGIVMQLRECKEEIRKGQVSGYEAGMAKQQLSMAKRQRSELENIHAKLARMFQSSVKKDPSPDEE